MSIQWKAATAATALLMALIGHGMAEGGPTRYDPKTKSFAVNYTYAQLPSVDLVMRGDSAIGQSQDDQAPPGSTIDNEVRSFLDDVNQVLYAATRGLARISKLEYVQGTENADFIIDLTTVSSRDGVAIPLAGSGTGVPGHFNLYYQTLARNPGGRQSITLTAAHELCHYFFGLPDEYTDRDFTAIRCPPTPGLGCLMDNYQNGGRGLPRGGWMGRLCSPNEHLSFNPPINYSTPVTGSCQTILSAFFRDRGNPDFDSLPENPILSAGGVAASTASAPLRDAAQKAAAKPLLKDRLAALLKGRPGGLLTKPDIDQLLGDAKTVLLATVEGASLSNADLLQAGQIAVGLLLGKPPSLAAIEGVLLDEAKQLRAKLGQPKTQAAIQDIVNKLILKARTRKELGGAEAAPANVAFSPEEMTFLAGVATGADQSSQALIVQGRKPNSAARRTIIYTPLPIKASYPGFPADLVKTQAEPLASYRAISHDGAEFFEKLLARNDKTNRIKIRSAFGEGSPDESMKVTRREKATDDSTAEKIKTLAQRVKAVETAADEAQQKEAIAALMALAPDDSTAFGLRVQELGEVMDKLVAEIEADRIENIVLLVPPEGLPDGFGPKLKALAEGLDGKPSIRLDIALVGSTALIPHLLRDLSVRSGGSIQTISGVDEIGAAFQRVSNSSTQGTWIAIPEQGQIAIKHAAAPNPPFNPLGFAEDKNKKALYERYEAIRRLPNHVAVDPAADGRKRLAFKPFYCDGQFEMELIVGFSQDLPVVVGGPEQPSMNFKLVAADQAIGRLNTEAGYLAFEEYRGKIEADDLGFDALAQGQELAPDPETTTAKYLVFRMPALADGGMAPGWYAPVLELPASYFKEPGRYVDDSIHYTFSVGKPKANAKLIASLVQANQVAPGDSDRGTLRGERVAVIQAQVNYGLPVLGAQVTAYVQRIDDNGGASMIRTIRLPLLDDGMGADNQANDGTYTVTVPLGQDRTNGAEYRVFIESLTRGESRFLPLESLPNPSDAGRSAADSKPMLTFQRATSLNFRVAPVRRD